MSGDEQCEDVESRSVRNVEESCTMKVVRKGCYSAVGHRLQLLFTE